MESQILIAGLSRNIRLTPTSPEGAKPIELATSRLLAYGEKDGVTQLILTGRETLDVRESTDHIDRLVRIAAS